MKNLNVILEAIVKVTIGLFLVNGVCNAKTTVYKDSSGAITGRSYQSGNVTTYTDETGAIIGRSTERNGIRTITDSSGAVIGTSKGRNAGSLPQPSATDRYFDIENRSQDRMRESGFDGYNNMMNEADRRINGGR